MQRFTPPSRPRRVIPASSKVRSDQVRNSAGGFVFNTGPFENLRRFLVLGTEGGTFYANEQKLNFDNITSLDKCLSVDHRATVDLIVEAGENAPKMDPVLFSYARACSTGTPTERNYTLSRLNDVCRIGTHLFMFMEYAMKMRGCGRGFRNAVSRWYSDKSARDLAFQVTKYAQREGWSHADVIRLGHPRVDDKSEHRYVFNYVLWKQGFSKATAPVFARTLPKAADSAKEYLSIVERVKNMDDVREVAKCVRDFRLPREVLPTEALKSPVVWEAMLDAGMPMTALLRNLGNLSSSGLLVKNDSKIVGLVTSQLTDDKYLQRARIHPVNIFVARRVYGQGHGDKGSNSWTPVPAVLDALEEAFYKSFGFVEPSGKKMMLALDVSGSMGWGKIPRMGVTPLEASALMAMTTARVEKGADFFAFSTQFSRLNLNADMKFEKVLHVMENTPMGGTDCSLPARVALSKGWKYDGIVIYTDNETWAGEHPHRALKEYRAVVSPKCKQVVVGMTATGFSIADPTDPLSLDVVGFDINTPRAISWFMGS